MKTGRLRLLNLLLIAALAFSMVAFVQPAQAGSTSIVISELRVRGPNGGSDEFIELYNLSTSPVNIGGWKINGSNSSGTTGTRVTITSGTTLNPGCHYLVTNSSTSGGPYSGWVVGDQTYGTGITDDGGIALLNALGTIVDQVGMSLGSAYKEGTPLASLGSSNVNRGYERKPGGTAGSGTDIDNNQADFQLLTPSDPQNLSSLCIGGGATPSLTINDVSLNEGNSGTTSFDFTVSLSLPAGAGGVTFDIATADNTATSATSPVDFTAESLPGQTIPAGSSSYTFSVLVNGDTTFEPNETFFVNVTNVTGATVADGQGQGTIVNDDVQVTPIHAIQGNGGTVTGPGPFTVEAIVVGDYQTQGSGQLRGFFLQEEDADADADPATSEGILVFCGNCTTPVAVGDKVRVTGGATEFFNMSQISVAPVQSQEIPGSVVVLSSLNTLPTPATVQLPVPGVPSGDLAAATAAINAYFEPIEGMLVTFPDTLSVSEYFELARYGQVILTEGGRLRTFTDANAPSAAGLIDHEINLASRTIILDDTDNRQNRPVDTPNTAYYHPVPGLSASNYFRGGDTITNLTGVLHWSFAGLSGTDAWRIRPVTEAAYTYAFTSVNARPTVPDVDGSVKVASFNVLNYFLTVDTTASNNVGTCGPSGTQDCRGADSTQELERQRTKMLAALSAINADVFGFMEMENTPDVEPLADIVAGLPGYAFIDTDAIGTDAIRVGIIYRTSTVQPVGDYAILDSSVDPDFIDTRNRPALAQTFEEKATGARFTVVVNHLKSKGSGCGPGDDDTTTGQGNCNGTRTLAAQALADWLATDPTGSGDSDVLIIGDLNSYAKEDPIVALENAGYTNLVAALGSPDAYGYVFDGQLGYLDHALTNSSLNPQVAGVAEWHINADEIPLFDYNDDVKDAGESSFEEESGFLPLYADDAFRTSDHDPIIIGLNLNAPPSVDAGGPYSVNEGSSVTLTATGSDPNGDSLTYAWDLDNSGSFETNGQNVSFDASLLDGPESYTVKVKATDPLGLSATANATVNVNNVAPTATFNAPASVNEGSNFALSLTNPVDVAADLGGLQYAFDCGTGYGALGSASTASCPTVDNGTLTVKGKVTDKDGGVSEYSATVTVNNVAPTATFNAPASVNEGSPIALALTNPADVPADLGSLQYAFDCGTGYGAFGSSNGATCSAVDNPGVTVKGKIQDKDGGVTEYTAAVTINNVLPTVSTPAISPEPSTEGQSVAATAAFSDPGVNDAPFTCTVDYGDGSGVLTGAVAGNSCTGPAHTYSTFGSYPVTISVTDKDSGTGSKSATHVVIFNWAGFFQPVDNFPTLNTVKGGQAIPVKFSLGGDKGLSIFYAGYPQSTRIACDSGVSMDDVEETVTAGSSSLSYSAGNDQYNYVWKTEKGWAGTCRQLIVKLVDGTTHPANFKFK